MSNSIDPLNSSGSGYYHPQNSHLLIRNRGVNEVSSNSQTPAARSKPSEVKPRVGSSTLSKLNPLNKLRDFLLFAPSRKVYSSPLTEGMNYKDVVIDTSDGEKLHGFFLPAQIATDKVVIYLHGQDLNVSRWFLAAKHIQDKIDVNFLVVDYRGYGKSTGKPTGEGVITDALSMYNFLVDNGFKPEDISVYGRSLGGAVGLELANRVKLKSVVVQSSFTSLRDIAKFRMPSIPSFLIRNNLFNSAEQVKKINIPILISHGDRDKIVPLSQSERLYISANHPKYYIVLSGAGHEHLKEYYTEEYFDVLKKLFL